MTDYANHPQSIAEARSDRTRCSQDWSPRDALIATLRDIDQGKIAPDQVIIVMAQKDGAEVDVTRSTAGPFTTLELLGMLSRIAHRMQVDP